MSRGLATDFGLGPGANEILENTEVISEIGKNYLLHYLALKAPPIICSRRQFQILPLFQK